MRVTSSTETDIYSATTSAIGSLKGPLHGGANLKVMDMMEDIKKNVNDWKNEGEIENYLLKILNKEANDHSGKIYGVGHAVYMISDPRAVLLKEKAKDLAAEVGRTVNLSSIRLSGNLLPKSSAGLKENSRVSLCAST